MQKYFTVLLLLGIIIVTSCVTQKPQPIQAPYQASNIGEDDVSECDIGHQWLQYRFVQGLDTDNNITSYITGDNTYSVKVNYKVPVTLIGPFFDNNMTCESRSMSPTINCDDTLIAFKPTMPSQISEGDIIGFGTTFNGQRIFMIHRVIQIINGTYTTKGDYNTEKDQTTTTFKDIEYKIVGVIHG